MEKFQEEQLKAIDIFFEGNDVSLSFPNSFGESLIYQAAPVIHRLSSLKETSDYIICAAH